MACSACRKIGHNIATCKSKKAKMARKNNEKQRRRLEKARRSQESVHARITTEADIFGGCKSVVRYGYSS